MRIDFPKLSLSWVILSLISFLVSWKIFSFLSTAEVIYSLEAVQKVAIVNSGFIVAAFNLKFRLTDLLLRDWYSIKEFQKLKNLVIGCSSRISRRIVFYVILSVLMALSPMGDKFLSDSHCLILLSVAVSGFILASYSFLELLSAFSRLEKTSAEFYTREVERKEKERRMQKVEDAKNA